MKSDSTSRCFSRRTVLRSAACGFGGVALQGLLAQESTAASRAFAPHHPPAAKRMIFIFLAGGPSQPDLFDPKPFIARHHGEKIDSPVEDNQLRVGVDNGFIAMKPVAPVRPRGESGMLMSDLLPNMAQHADGLCLLQAMYTDNKAHFPATLQFHTGSLSEARPSMGAWISYGLGTENHNLPGFITIHPPSDVRTYGCSFLPGRHQGTPVAVPKDKNSLPIKYLNDSSTDASDQRQRLDFVQSMNQKLLNRFRTDAQMEGIIESFELAFRMQAETPELVDLSNETQETLNLYGINGGASDRNGRACLLARRMSEAGVRCVQVTMDGWDHHGDILNALPNSCERADKPMAALLSDLRRRGLLDETLVMISGEFGRSPWSQDLSGTSPIEKHGREHQQESFCTLLAGGGIKPGLTYGATDDFGYNPVQGRVHLYDLQATVLHQLGIDHERLTYRHEGRDVRLTDVYGNVVHDILA